MEPIGKISMDRSLQVANSSQIDPIANSIPVDKQRAMGDVLDRWRLNNGWNPLDDKTQMASIASYVHELDAERVPHQCYSELYSRAIKSRIAAIQSGKQMPNFGVELLLAEWLGPHGLRAELKDREIASGRILTSNAESICLKCDGTGMERVKDAQGRIGLKKGCDHEYTPAEPETMSGFDLVQNRVRVATVETSDDIFRRLRALLARDWHEFQHDETKSQAAWNAQRTLMHAEKYVREVEMIISEV